MDLPVALDAMGGDRAPDAMVEGAVRAYRAGVPVMLVGDEERLHMALRTYEVELPVVHAPDVIGMDERAVEVRRRKRASIAVAADEVASGRASALVSMGHSGATMAAALFRLGRLKGVERPAIVAHVPARTGFVTLLDVGANADCRPAMLQQFAVMGSVYARVVFGHADPAVGLMSIGEEASKGNELVRATHPLLASTPGIRFHGNVEGNDLFSGAVPVIVTDGFTGNVMLKLAEGEAKMLFASMRDELRASLRGRLGGWLARPALRAVADKVDPASYGAQPLLGVGAPAFIGHGSSGARAVHSALRFAHDTATRSLVRRMAAELEGQRSDDDGDD
ncbi:MAG: phosphate acyltransferase PlsX [Trueperaceae bacterium]|nr:phosphate acyltransferase PlsX [Trueperaceae bacterium]